MSARDDSVRSQTRSRFAGAFLGCMLGDAFGRVLEGASARDLEAAGAVERRARVDSVWGFSDDTEMMASVAESLLECGRVDPERLLCTLAARHDPARGYGHGVRRGFEALLRGDVSWRDVATLSWAEGSRGNGGAVRVVPVACLYHREPDALAAAADASARVTHAHPIARLGAVLHANALALALAHDARRPLDGRAFLRALIARLPDEEAVFRPKLERCVQLLSVPVAPADAAGELGCGVTADESVPLALYAFARGYPRFEERITHVARAGGDVDTIAAMSGALAGALDGVESLPAEWLVRLENGPGGRDAVRALAERLFERWDDSVPRDAG